MCWWNDGSSPKMIISTTGRPMLPIMFVGCLRTSLASLRTTWPKALMPVLLPCAGSFR